MIETSPAFTWETVDTGSTGPGPRSRHGLIHDPVAGATVLFGGIVWEGGGRLRNDTWELKGGGWSPIHAPLFQRPQARHRGALVFDEARGHAVLFGGQGASFLMLNDTWTYADRRWRRLKSWWWRRPSPRCGHALAYDAGTRQTVLFGGVGGFGRSLGDTWVLEGNAWRRIQSLGTRPSPRRYAAFAYDPGHQGCVLHGGAYDDAGHRQFGDAWLFRGESWSRLPPGFETDDRDDHGLAYHRAARSLVMLDGLQGRRELLAGGDDGWRPAPTVPLHPRHQCSPLAWNDGLDGLVLHGGEVRHGGPQFQATLVLRLLPGDDEPGDEP